MSSKALRILYASVSPWFVVGSTRDARLRCTPQTRKSAIFVSGWHSFGEVLFEGWYPHRMSTGTQKLQIFTRPTCDPSMLSSISRNWRDLDSSTPVRPASLYLRPSAANAVWNPHSHSVGSGRSPNGGSPCIHTSCHFPPHPGRGRVNPCPLPPGRSVAPRSLDCGSPVFPHSLCAVCPCTQPRRFARSGVQIPGARVPKA